MIPTLREQHEQLASAVRGLSRMSGLAAAQHAPAILEQQLALNSLLVASIEHLNSAVIQILKKENQ